MNNRWSRVIHDIDATNDVSCWCLIQPFPLGEIYSSPSFLVRHVMTPLVQLRGKALFPPFGVQFTRPQGRLGWRYEKPPNGGPVFFGVETSRKNLGGHRGAEKFLFPISVFFFEKNQLNTQHITCENNSNLWTNSMCYRS